MNSLPPPISPSTLPMPSLPTAQPAYQQPLILQQTTPQTRTDTTFSEKSMGQKFRIAVLVSFLFMLLSSHAAFRILNQVVVLIMNTTSGILDEDGCATLKSTLFMGIVFFFVTFFFILR